MLAQRAEDAIEAWEYGWVIKSVTAYVEAVSAVPNRDEFTGDSSPI